MPPDPDILNLLGDLYAVATDSSAWDLLARRLTEVFACTASFIYLIDNEAKTGMAPVVHEFSEEAAIEYGTEVMHYCPRYKNHIENPHQKVLFDYQHSDESQMDRDLFYNWIGKSVGVRYYMATAQQIDKHRELAVTLHQTKEKGHFQRHDMARFAMLLPHFERIVQIRSRLGYLDARMQAADAALDRLSSGVVVVNASGAIASMNRAAENLLRDNDGLLLDRGHLKAKHWDDNKTLQATIRQAALTSMQRSRERSDELVKREL